MKSVGRYMRLAPLAMFALVNSVQAGPREDAAELLAAWQPVSVQIIENFLIVVLPQSQITETIYKAVILAGLCIGPLIDKPLDGIDSITVLNQNKKQGYIYEKGLEDCEDFNNRPVGDKRTTIELLSATRLF